VEVIGPYGAGSKANAYEYVSSPTVTGVNPSSGPQAGGTNVTVTGVNFFAPATVDFGGSLATSVSVVDASTITCQTTAHAAGTVDVTVTTDFGGDTLPLSYTYIGAPAPAAVSPSAGPVGGGQSVTVSGTWFYSPASVAFGGTAATGVSVVSDTEIACVTPAHAVGAVDVAVSSVYGTGTAAGAYTYVDPPVVTLLNPNVGPAAGGTHVTISGLNFYGPASVDFGGSLANNVSVVSTTRIECDTTAHIVQTVNVTVYGAYGNNTKTAGFTYMGAPTVNAVTPALGPSTGGSAVTIQGSSFYDGVTVIFGGEAATSVSVVNPGRITCVTPAHAAGLVDVSVTTQSGAGTKTGAFTYGDVPAVSSVTPDKGPVAGGTAVTVTGTAFASPATVTFGGALATSVSVVDASTITCQTPAHAAGLVAVEVITGYGSGSQADAYEYVAPPTVTSVTPDAGTTAGGTAVTIGGTTFVGVQTVAFGGAAASGVSVVDASTITCTTPAHAAGAVDVVVTAVGGTGSSVGGYLYVEPPVFSVAPYADPDPTAVNKLTNFHCAVHSPGGYTPVTVTWDFGDGTPTGSGENTTHTYTVAGTKTVTVTAVDSKNVVTQTSFQLVVKPPEFSGDSFADILWWNNQDGTVYLWEMGGGGNPLALKTETFLFDEDEAQYQIVATGDFNQDGTLDLVEWQLATGVVYLRMVAGGVVGPRYRLGSASPSYWSVRGAGDFDQDGVADVLFRRDTGVVYCWLIQGGATPIVKSGGVRRLGYATPEGWEITAGAGDYDNNGYCDMLWREKAPGNPGPNPAPYCWLLGGWNGIYPIINAVVRMTPDVGEGLEWQLAGTADFDGDGKDDLLWRNDGTGEQKVWLMDGTTRLSMQVLPDLKLGAEWDIVGPR
jgi:hypothetical protein